MRWKSNAIVCMLFWLISAPAIYPQNRQEAKSYNLCNQDGTLCAKDVVQQSVVQNPLYIEFYVTTPGQVVISWELRDNTGNVLDQDPDGRLVFLVKKLSASQRIVAVRDFALAPAKSTGGKMLLHAKTYSVAGQNQPLPELSISLRLDTRTRSLTYAVPGKNFSQAVRDGVESSPRSQMQAEVDWRSTTVLHVKPTMIGGAAAEATARAYLSQEAWHVIDYREVQGTAHLTMLGNNWAGVTYYLVGLHFLLDQTMEHRSGVQHVVYDKPPEFGK